MIQNHKVFIIFLKQYFALTSQLYHLNFKDILWKNDLLNDGNNNNLDH